MPQRDDILQQALRLARDDRAYVAQALEESLPSSGFGTPQLAAAWRAEIERRIAAYDRGELKTIDGESFLDGLRKSLAEFRARRVAS